VRASTHPTVVVDEQIFDARSRSETSEDHRDLPAVADRVWAGWGAGGAGGVGLVGGDDSLAEYLGSEQPCGVRGALPAV